MCACAKLLTDGRPTVAEQQTIVQQDALPFASVFKHELRKKNFINAISCSAHTSKSSRLKSFLIELVPLNETFCFTVQTEVFENRLLLYWHSVMIGRRQLPPLCQKLLFLQCRKDYCQNYQIFDENPPFWATFRGQIWKFEHSNLLSRKVATSCAQLHDAPDYKPGQISAAVDR